MQNNSWEGSILAFVMITTVLIGGGYVISINTGLAVPWLALVVIALLVTMALRLRRPPK